MSLPGVLSVKGVADKVGELTINSVLMHTPGFNVLTPVPFWYGLAVRGENIQVGGAPGMRATPLEINQQDFILPMMVSGAVDKDGTEDPDGPFACLFRNFSYLRENVFGPVDGVTATWPASIAYVWGDTYEADVQVLDIGEVYVNTYIVKTNLTIRVPAGEFTLVEP